MVPQAERALDLCPLCAGRAQGGGAARGGAGHLPAADRVCCSRGRHDGGLLRLWPRGGPSLHDQQGPGEAESLPGHLPIQGLACRTGSEPWPCRDLPASTTLLSHTPCWPVSLTPCCVQHPIIGLAFMAVALILETTLFILRTTVPPKLHQEAARRAVAARVAKQQEQHLTEQRAGADGGRSSGGGGSSGGDGSSQEASTTGGHASAWQAAGAVAAAKPAEQKKDD